MTLRENLSSPATRGPTVALLISGAALLVLVLVMLLAIPAMLEGGAGALLAWLPYLYVATLTATMISSVALSRRRRGPS